MQDFAATTSRLLGQYSEQQMQYVGFHLFGQRFADQISQKPANLVQKSGNWLKLVAIGLLLTQNCANSAWLVRKQCWHLGKSAAAVPNDWEDLLVTTTRNKLQEQVQNSAVLSNLAVLVCKKDAAAEPAARKRNRDYNCVDLSVLFAELQAKSVAHDLTKREHQCTMKLQLSYFCYLIQLERQGEITTKWSC